MDFLVQLLQVWLKLTGLPIEHYCFSSVEVLVSRFGRQHRCNMEKKKKKRFLGAFHVMIDCHDIDEIPPRVDFHNDDDEIVPVYIDKEYTCLLDAYKVMNFDDHIRTYEEILTALIDSGKLIPM